MQCLTHVIPVQIGCDSIDVSTLWIHRMNWMWIAILQLVHFDIFWNFVKIYKTLADAVGLGPNLSNFMQFTVKISPKFRLAAPFGLGAAPPPSGKS